MSHQSLDLESSVGVGVSAGLVGTDIRSSSLGMVDITSLPRFSFCDFGGVAGGLTD